MKLTAIIVIVIVSVSSEDFAPIYSPSYANVYYQRSEGGTTRNGEKLKLAEQQEELVPTQAPDNTKGITGIYEGCIPTSDPDTTTEPYSEQVPFGKRINRRRNKAKEAIELSEEFEPSESDTSEPSIHDLNGQGIYYIYHPNGLLQKVIFATKNDQQNMKYSAQFNYRNVQPILEPIYTYDPNTFAFQRLELHPN